MYIKGFSMSNDFKPGQLLLKTYFVHDYKYV